MVMVESSNIRLKLTEQTKTSMRIFIIKKEILVGNLCPELLDQLSRPLDFDDSSEIDRRNNTYY
jgi:hypothetical protein